ncbi:MAG: lytic transglycosylase domain-containing protein [Mesorhizobium sp.]
MAKAAPLVPLIAPLTAEFQTLREGLDALARDDLRDVFAARDRLPVDGLERKTLNWALVSRQADPGSEAEKLEDWPGFDRVEQMRERTVARAGLEPAELIEAFANRTPQTFEGTRALARAHIAAGNAKAARDILAPLWRREKLDSSVETALIAEFSDVLTRDDHLARMEAMFIAERVGSAMRVATLAKSTKLAAAWAAAIRNERNALELLDKVPQAERSSGFFYAKARYLRRTEKYKEAAAAILAAPADASAIADPDSWWRERRVLSRELLDIGEPRAAYQVAAAHVAESPEMQADAEFHAGWYALRFLNEPVTAAKHFQKIADISSGAISLSRAYYWLGRAIDAGAPGDRAATYERAAVHLATFYGQLASEKLGRNVLPANDPVASADDVLALNNREELRVIRLLESAGHGKLAEPLYRTLAQSLTNPGELALLCDYARKRDPMLALRLGKIAASRGLQIGTLAHPTGAIPSTAEISSSGMALAYAIARQESEFNPAAVSRAGARGLLQLMPATARDVARKTGMSYAPERLTSDPGYNATLGSAFLSEQLRNFSGSYILTFAGYNAGPRRANEWVKRYGDPRGKEIDEVVDWIERIPFTETRHYVQRVMENYQVYKVRLSGEFAIASDLIDGRTTAQ